MKTRTKITAAIVLTAIVSGAVFGGLSYYQSRNVVSQAAFADLEALRDAKSTQIEEFFEQKTKAADSLSRDVLVATAMTDLQAAFRNINQGGETVLADVSSNVRDYYERRALPPIAKSLGIRNAPYDIYGPKTRAARHLQNVFNVQPRTSGAPRQKSYEALHRLYDDKLKSMAAVNGFADMLLIDLAQGDVVYSAQKGIDFGSNIYYGAFASSALGDIIDEVRNAPDVHISDIDLYVPARNEASAFVAVPVYDQNIPIGILALRFKAEQVSALSAFGLKERGDRDVYLAGSDYLMRSNAPFARDNLNAYVRMFKDAGGSDDAAQKIKLSRSTILAQSVETEAVTTALSGKSGAMVTQNYLGNDVISAYAPIGIGENDWVILAERRAADVYTPLTTFAERLAIAAAIFVPLLLLFSLWMASRLMRPARAMLDRARAISSGQNLTFAENSSEWGRIGSELNKVVDLEPWRISIPKRQIAARNPIKLISIETLKAHETKTPIVAEVKTPAPKKFKFKTPKAKPIREKKAPKKEKPPVAVLVPKAPVENVPPEVEIQEAVSSEEARKEIPIETLLEPLITPPIKVTRPPVVNAPVEAPKRSETQSGSVSKFKKKRPKRAARSDAGLKKGTSSTQVIAPRARRKTLPPMHLVVNQALEHKIQPNQEEEKTLVLTQSVEAITPKPSKPVGKSEQNKSSESGIAPLSEAPSRFRRRRRR